MSKIPQNRVNVTHSDSPLAAQRPSPAVHAPHASILKLHRKAGNRSVVRLLTTPGVILQRKVGWSQPSTQGLAWNQDEKPVGNVRRIPLEGLSEGLSANRPDEQARLKWQEDPADKTKGKWVMEPTDVPALSSESAKGRAIVLVPDGLDATQPIEVVVFLHGFTEDASRPFAGWRELSPPATRNERLIRLRQGIDASDTAPVRDVALDQAEQQLEDSGKKQLVIVLPQGGRHSQFGKEGGHEFLSGPYVAEIIARLRTEKRWKDGAGKLVDTAPAVSRVIMAGHSGAGATLGAMADRSVAEAKAAALHKTLAPGSTSALTGDLVIYDAINGDQLSSFVSWATMRLNQDLAVLTDTTKSDADRFLHLQSAPKLRGYTTDTYIRRYIELDKAINRWFADHGSQLGAWAPCLRANYVLEYLDVDHEELMRGSTAGTTRAKGTGTILDAITALDAPLMTSTASCPAMPKPLAERWKNKKEEEEQQRREEERKKQEEERKRREERRKARQQQGKQKATAH